MCVRDGAGGGGGGSGYRIKKQEPHTKVVGNYVLLRDFRTVEDSDGKFSA